MRVGSLFAGIGGFDLGLQRAGMRIVWQVEIDEFARAVLARHWPDVPKYGDVRELTGDELDQVDLICGGWPCQPFSYAGKRRGSADERDLWPEFIRIIRRLKPRWVVGENVPGVLTADSGRYFGRILRDLAESGYDAAWRVLRAADVGAPHLRQRLFLVAHASRSEPERGRGPGEMAGAPGVREDDWRQREWVRDAARRGGASLADAQGLRRDRPGAPRYGRGRSADGGSLAHAEGEGLPSGPQRRSGAWTPAESVLGRVFDGLPAWLDGHRWPAGRGERQYDWEPARTVSRGEVPNRVARLRALGNAVVPQLAEAIGWQIMAYESSAWPRRVVPTLPGLAI